MRYSRKLSCLALGLTFLGGPCVLAHEAPDHEHPDRKVEILPKWLSRPLIEREEVIDHLENQLNIDLEGHKSKHQKSNPPPKQNNMKNQSDQINQLKLEDPTLYEIGVTETLGVARNRSSWNFNLNWSHGSEDSYDLEFDRPPSEYYPGFWKGFRCGNEDDPQTPKLYDSGPNAPSISVFSYPLF